MGDGRDASGGGARGVPGHPWCILATEQPKTRGETEVKQGRKGEITPQSPKAKCPWRTSVQQDLLTGRGTIRERQGHPAPTLFASLHLHQPNSPRALPFPFILPKTGPASRPAPGCAKKVTPMHFGMSREDGEAWGFLGQRCKCKASPRALAGELARGVPGHRVGTEGLVVAAALLLSAPEVALGDAKKPTPELKRLWKIKSSIWK